MNILVTGGTGFIGSHIVRQLLKLGHKVSVCARESSSLRFIPKKKVNILYADIRDYCQLEKITHGFDLIYHTAALSSDWGSKNDFLEINTQGTLNILKAGFKNGVSNFIHLSSCAVLGEESNLLAKDESSPYNPRQGYPFSFLLESDMNYYRISKTLAEIKAMEFCQDKKINLTIIRAPWVYGPRELHAGPYIFFKTLQEGFKILPFNGNTLLHFVYVEDLAINMAKLAEKQPQGNSIFIMADNKPLLLKNFIAEFCAVLKINKPFSLPEIFFMPFAILLEFLYKTFRIKTSPFINRARAKIYYCNNIYDTAKAKQQLSLTAETPTARAIKKTARWWKINSFLK